MRVLRKLNVLRAYPKLREEISRTLLSAPELIKFVDPPSAFTMTYGVEIALHHQAFEFLKQLTGAELEKMLADLTPFEDELEEEFWEARKRLADSERQLLGFEIYGKDARHYYFRGVLHNYGIERRPDIVDETSFKQNVPLALMKLDRL